MSSSFASLDGTALRSLDFEAPPVPAHAIARRSVSIFSRRGVETPEPSPPFIVQAVRQQPIKQQPVRLQPRQMTDRQKSWLSRRRSPSSETSTQESQKPQKPRGTVLNLVPKAPTINMTALEEEMATSPNEEILSAISGSPVSPAHPPRGLWDTSGVPLTQRTKSAKRKETNTRIGIWVNGIVELDEDVMKERVGDEEPSLQSQTGFTACTPAPSKAARPLLTVVIPGKEPLINDKTISRLCQPMPSRPVSLAPADIVSKYHLSSASDDRQSIDVSPVGSDSVQATPISPPERPKAPSHICNYLKTTPPIAEHARSSSSESSHAVNRSSSIGSKRSSATSLEVIAAVDLKAESDAPNVDPLIAPDVNKPLPQPPIEPPTRAPPPPPSSPLKSPPKAGHERSISTRPAPAARRKPPRPLQLKRASKSLNEKDFKYQSNVRAAAYHYSDPESPTLSEAEQNLERQLLSLAGGSSNADDDKIDHDNTVKTAVVPTTDRQASVHRSNSVRSVMHPPEQAPRVPKRSRRREWRISSGSSRSGRTIDLPRRKSASDLTVSLATQGAMVGTLRRSASACQLRTPNHSPQQLHSSASSLHSSVPNIVIDDGLIVVDVEEDMYGDDEEQAMAAAAAAQEVLLHILLSLGSLEDLFNTGRINKGMYRVYRDNEMDLVRAVTWNQSPAAWELREWTPPHHINNLEGSQASLQLDYTPKSYTHCYRRDREVVLGLKRLILQHCSSVIRHETALGLQGGSAPNAQRYEDALWRLWSFCQIFGCGKGREDDVTGQLDWLKGGILANNQDLTATMNVNLDFDMGSVLLNPPPCFAQGNCSGLSAQQLYDMIELWNCLTSIIQSYHGRYLAAEAHGVFAGCAIEGQYTESQILEEWTAYLMTLGPPVIFEMAECAGSGTDIGFSLAQERGWTQWSLSQYSGSRIAFLKEPLTRLYEERVSAAMTRLSSPRDTEVKEVSRKRVANMAAEIKLARRASSHKRVPVVETSMQRSMSSTSHTSRTAPTLPHRPLITRSTTNPPNTSTALPPNFSIPRRTSPAVGTMRTITSLRTITPIIEERPEPKSLASLQNFEGVAEDTSARAVKRIVDMGFSRAQAMEALRLTDMGDGLRVDRAVDLLLRRQET